MLTRIAVKDLAEFVHRRGDLHPPLGGRVTGEEGIAGQRRAQQGRPASYRREVAVAEEFSGHGLTLRVSGRLDGCDLDARPPLVEEIKTTRAEPETAERHLGSAHWAQVMLYAALLIQDPAAPEHPAWHLRLLYCHPRDGAGRTFQRTLEPGRLRAFLRETVDTYLRWLRDQQDYQVARNRWLGRRAFPYGGFRPHQRALAGRVHRALRHGEHLLLEAPTGSGKTMGVLFPALKVLSGGHLGRLFYLTSRGTGARAVLQACEDLRQGAGRIRVLELTAREKACAVEGMPCGEGCPYAEGYYDRVRNAVPELLAVGHMDREAVRAVAEKHTVCPFELSLDAALWADLLVGDYNYLLDPVVRLQRFAGDAGLGLLVDESHQLADRAREMLSTRIERSDVRAALAESPPEGLRRRLKGLDRALLRLRRERLDGDAAERVIPRPASLLRAMERCVEALADQAVDLAAYPATRSLLFTLSRWLRSAAWMQEGAQPEAGLDPAEGFRYLASARSRGARASQVCVRLCCLDPAPYLASLLGSYGPHVRFSGTLSPLPLHQHLHGEAGGPAERVASPFSPGQLALMVVPDLPVYYQQRARSLPGLADLVAGVVAARTGNYLVALPSFEYLERLAAELARRHPAMPTACQRPAMDPAERAAFLEGFRERSATRVGLVVLGGVFAESVDFSHAPLAGVICVGVGLPPVSRLREEMRRYYQQRLGAGHLVAYQQPAMTRVLQMAGRLLRSPSDRGLLCLVDERFNRPAFRQFFPAHWDAETVRARDAADRAAAFWRFAENLPADGEGGSRHLAAGPRLA